jgi:hypothetical protein
MGPCEDRSTAEKNQGLRGRCWVNNSFFLPVENVPNYMIPASYKPKKKFMQLAIAEAKRASDRGDYPIGPSRRLTGRLV